MISIQTANNSKDVGEKGVEPVKGSATVRSGTASVSMPDLDCLNSTIEEMYLIIQTIHDKLAIVATPELAKASVNDLFKQTNTPLEYPGHEALTASEKRNLLSALAEIGYNMRSILESECDELNFRIREANTYIEEVGKTVGHNVEDKVSYAELEKEVANLRKSAEKFAAAPEYVLIAKPESDEDTMVVLPKSKLTSHQRGLLTKVLNYKARGKA